jgi:hypothetical protein
MRLEMERRILPVTFMEPARDHNDECVVGGPLIAVAEGVGDRFDTNALLGSPRLP